MRGKRKKPECGNCLFCRKLCSPNENLAMLVDLKHFLKYICTVLCRMNFQMILMS